MGCADNASANLFINGSFETVGAFPGSSASSYTTNYAAIAANTLTGWTSTVSSQPNAANYLSTFGSTANWIPDPINGNYSLQLDSSTNSGSFTGGNSISQTVSLLANTPYQLTFEMSAEAARGQTTTSQLDVTLNGGGFASFSISFTASRTGSDTKATSSQWFQQTMNFTPSASGNVTFTFQDVFVANGTSSNSSLDNIDLQAVPEPRTMSLVLIGVVGLAGAAFRQRRKLKLSKSRAS